MTLLRMSRSSPSPTTELDLIDHLCTLIISNNPIDDIAIVHHLERLSTNGFNLNQQCTSIKSWTQIQSLVYPRLMMILSRNVHSPSDSAINLDQILHLIGVVSGTKNSTGTRQWNYSFGNVNIREVDRVEAGLGSETWHSGIMMSRLIDDGSINLDGKRRILELGSGTGLAGIVAAIHCDPDKTSVILSDGDPGVLVNLRHNVAINSTKFQLDHVVVTDLNWSRPPSIGSSTIWTGRFDLILAADICYDVGSGSVVMNLVDRLLSNDGQFHVVMPFRSLFSDFLEQFLQDAENSGFFLETFVDLPSETPNDRTPSCRYYCYKRRRLSAYSGSVSSISVTTLVF